VSDVLIDPTQALTSVLGIVTLTIAIVHIIKRDLCDTPYFARVPTWIYAMAVSAVLTYLSHAILHTIEGELAELLTQAVIQALLAAGALDTWRNRTKPIADTSVAERARQDRARRE
jgi:hypothetical protein